MRNPKIKAVVMAFAVVGAFPLWADDAPTADASLSAELTPALQAMSDSIWREQIRLNAAMDSLADQGASDLQIDQWMQANGAHLQQREKQFSACLTLRPMTYIDDVPIPETASTTTENYLVLQAELYNRFAEIHNELVMENNGVITPARAAAVEEKANDLLQNEFAAALVSKDALAKQMAEESAHQPMEVPVLTLPANANPTLVSFLKLQYRITCGEVTVHNQTRNRTQHEQDWALEQWQRQNAELYQQLSQLAIQLAQSSATNPMEDSL